MIFKLYFVVKGKQYAKSYKNISDAENAKRYVAKRGATDIEIRASVERKDNDNHD